MIEVVVNILMDWNYSFVFPDYLKDFIIWCSDIIEKNKTILNSNQYIPKVFTIEDLLIRIVYLTNIKNNKENWNNVFNDQVKKINPEKTAKKYNFLVELVQGESCDLKELSDLKTDLLSELSSLFRVSSLFVTVFKTKNPIYKNFYNKYKDVLKSSETFLYSIERHLFFDDKNDIWSKEKDHKDNLLFNLISSTSELGRKFSDCIDQIETDEKNLATMKNNLIIIDLLKDHYLNNTYKLYDFKDEVEDHLYDKYIEIAKKHNWKNIEQSAFNRFLLRVPDRVEFSNEILKDFHGKEESEQTIILELLFLSGGDLPNENYYSNRYQFHLVSLIISMNWDRQEYLVFFTNHLKSDNQENAISCLIHSTKVNSALWDTDDEPVQYNLGKTGGFFSIFAVEVGGYPLIR